jgi:hypothetical protein
MLVGISEAIRLLFFNYFFWCVASTIAIYNRKDSSFKVSPISSYDNTLLLLRDEDALNLNGNGGVYYLQSLEAIGQSQKKEETETFSVPDKDKKFFQWLAGIIDGDGSFKISKKGYASLEIVMDIRDKHCLYQIKQKFGGSVKLRSGINWLRYRLHHKIGLLNLIHAVNGEIRNPVRLIQLNKICLKYDIPLIPSKPLTYNNDWLSGFIDSDGSVYLNLISSQLFGHYCSTKKIDIY